MNRACRVPLNFFHARRRAVLGHVSSVHSKSFYFPTLFRAWHCTFLSDEPAMSSFSDRLCSPSRSVDELFTRPPILHFPPDLVSKWPFFCNKNKIKNLPLFISKTMFDVRWRRPHWLCLLEEITGYQGELKERRRPLFPFPSRLVSLLLLANVVFNFTRKTINGREFL